VAKAEVASNPATARTRLAATNKGDLAMESSLVVGELHREAPISRETGDPVV